MMVGPRRSFGVLGGVVLLVTGLMMASAAAAGEEAPGVEWTRQFGTSGDDWVDGLALDSGGVYVTGVAPGALPGQINTGGADVFVRKFDLDGNELWTRQFGTSADDRGIAVAVDDGAVYLTGFTYGALPGHANAGSRDVFVRKYDVDGNEQWTRQFGTTGEDLGIAVAVDAEGVYLAGGTKGALPGGSHAGGWDVFARRYDLDGNEQWTRQFGTVGDDLGPGLAVHGDGMYLTGYTDGALPDQTSAGGLDAWVRRYDLDGNERWTRQFGTPGDDSGASVAVDTTGLHVAGDTTGVFPGQSGAGPGDVFVRRYSLDGNDLWTRQFGTDKHDSAQDMAVDTTGLYLTGHTTGEFPGQTHTGAKDVWLRKLEFEGSELWTRQFGTAGDDWGLGVAVGSEGGVYLTGPTRGVLPGQASAGNLDVWVRRYGADALCGGAAVTIAGSDGADVITGTPGDDVIDARGGDDTVFGRGGNDIVCGGDGNDTLRGGPDQDFISGGEGHDMLYGGSAADTLRGEGGGDWLWGDQGNDDLDGGNGDDVLRGWVGDDVLSGGADNDRLYGGPDADTVSGGDGYDVLYGGPGPDTLNGDGSGDRLWGNLGSDSLDGGTGDDVLWGWVGDDVLSGGADNDRLHGGPDQDTISGGDGHDELFGGPDPDTLNGDGGDDLLWGHQGNDTMSGGDGNDVLRGWVGDDVLSGGADHDRLYGSADDDIVNGDAGDDTLDGGDGTDTLDGGLDTDTCTNGEIFNSCEVIL